MTDKQRSPADELKRAMASTMRALSRDSGIELEYASDAPAFDGKTARVVRPHRSLPAAEVTRARGQADAWSVRKRFHDAGCHARHAPKSPLGREVYDAMEQARVECLGSVQMAGVGENIAALIDDRCRERGLHQAAEADDVSLPAVLDLMARERMLDQAPPEAARGAVDLLRAQLEDKAAPILERMAEVAHDQAAFAHLTQDLLGALDIGDDRPDEESHADPEEGQDDQDEAGAEEQDGEGEGGGDEHADQGETPETAEADTEDQQAEGGEAVDMDRADMDADAADQSIEGAPWRPNQPMSDLPVSRFYKAFSTEYDEIVTAADLCDEEELDRLRAHLDQQMVHLSHVVSRLANRLQRRLMAQQNRSWQFDLEEGLLDPARLARVVAQPTQPLSYKQETDIEFRDTVVTLLLDNSGSMRGRPISIAAVCADILGRTLERCGVKTEILGFTTSAWKGGRSREAWLNQGKPSQPGRLNDLRHIIYKSADAPWRRSRRNLGLMMREGLLKENIDGEALLWAHNRLIGRPEERRIMMVISDGAPVDDSTLSVNSGSYLEQHLRQVIKWIEGRSPVELIAIGIGHDVTRYYRRAVTIMDAEQLGGAMTNQLAKLFEEERGHSEPVRPTRLI
ncbi:cobaltochelatase subunit CobT [Rhodothalassium salexigens]|uniref:cobaltochelatase subunit CobT n=1 Tax=Rhodothalassium salexigens TaxID=1086 RepID=UPI001913E189|nr:cobaltochelatase subunit CobT [Rhodothalassium salexigens]MBK5921941.1 cobaltochelatase subunit CobT [Rhodothalassium salexigens]